MLKQKLFLFNVQLNYLHLSVVIKGIITSDSTIWFAFAVGILLEGDRLLNASSQTSSDFYALYHA